MRNRDRLCPLSRSQVPRVSPDLAMKRHVLTPDDLHRAADAFAAALERLDERTCEMHPYTARHLLARHIIANAFSGDQDLEALCNGALDHLRREAAKEAGTRET